MKISFAAIISVLCLLPVIGRVWVRDSYLPIFESNGRMLEQVMEYGDEFCSQYVSVKRDENLHREILAELQRLSDEICADAETDREKVAAIEYWVADNIYYNHSAAETAVTAEVISLETVLETKTTTCAGYANIFSALCNMQGIYCINLRGGTFVRQDTPDYLQSVPMNHEWNAVVIDGKWIFADTAWLSNNEYRDGQYYYAGDFDEEYFSYNMDFKNMCYEHRIDLADYRNFKSSINAFE